MIRNSGQLFFSEGFLSKCRRNHHRTARFVVGHSSANKNNSAAKITLYFRRCYNILRAFVTSLRSDFRDVASQMEGDPGGSSSIRLATSRVEGKSL